MYSTHPGTRALAGGCAPNPALAPVWPCPVVQTCFPTGHWAEAEGAQWAVAGVALQRQAKAFPTGDQRGYLKGGGHKSGKEGTGSFSVTSEIQQANIPRPMFIFSHCSVHLAQTTGSKQANPSLPFGVRRKNLEPKGVATASSGTWWTQGQAAAITED